MLRGLVVIGAVAAIVVILAVVVATSSLVSKTAEIPVKDSYVLVYDVKVSCVANASGFPVDYLILVYVNGKLTRAYTPMGKFPLPPSAFHLRWGLTTSCWT